MVPKQKVLSDSHALSVQPHLQTKLEVGRPDDKFEKEADAVADKVMMMPSATPADPPMPGNADTPVLHMAPALEPAEVQMVCEDCEEEKVSMKVAESSFTMVAMSGNDEDDDKVQPKSISTKSTDDEEVQMKAEPGGKRYASAKVSQEIQQQSGSGQPLDPGVGAEMGEKIGADFSDVKVHTGPKATQLNTALGAQAFTYGNNIYFNEGKYNPASSPGKHLLAHELTHTVQQGAAVQTKPEISRTQPKVQGLFDFVRERLNEYARYIPGWTLFTVIIGYNPLLGRSGERNGENLIGGLLELIPVFGVLMMNKLREHNIITDAFNWVNERLASLDLSLNRLERTIDAAYDDMDFIRLDPVDYNVGVLRRHFTPLLNDVMTFVRDVGTKILDLIKNALLTALKAVADALPGYPLLTKILGVDPLTGTPVVSTTAEKIESFLILIGKERELEKMRAEGTIQRTADWLDAELAQLNFSIDEIVGLFTTAWDAFSMADLQHPIEAFNRTVNIFRPFLSRVFTFAYNVGSKVLQFIKDALLSQLSSFAREQRGYHLLTVLLGRDPFTNEVVERNVENIIRGFMSLMDGGEQQFQQMKETGAIERTTERVNAAVEELGFNLSYIVGLFVGLWNSFTIDDIFNPLGAFRRIIDTLGEPLMRLFTFIVRIVRIVIEVLLEVMNFPFDTINSIINNAMQAFEDIKRDPIGFLKNLLAAVKQGFSQFFDNILTHLLNGLRDWLFGELASAGIQPPADISFRSILGFVLDTLGISVDNIWDRLGRRIGAERVAQIRAAIDTMSGVWTFVKDVYERGPIAIWEYVQEQLGNLWDTVIGMIRDWIMNRIITQITTRLLTMLDPTGIMAVVNGFIAFYRAVQSFIEKLRQMLEIVNSFVVGVANIARGDISQAANFLEQALARAIPVAIGFLANQVGLRGLGTRISEMIQGLRERVNGAIDWLIDRALRAGGALLNMGRQAAGTVMGWLGLRRPFTLPNGERHEMYFENSTPQARIIVASTDPLTLEQIISQRTWNGETIPPDKLTTIQTEAASINSKRGSTTVEQGREIQSSFNRIIQVLNSIGGAPVPPTTVVTRRTRGAGTSEMGEEVFVKPVSLNPGSLAGSQPTVDSDMGNELKRRYPNYFVAGHLLNHNLHGPGNQRWNLTPITQRANSAMKEKTEHQAKTKVLSEGKVISYRVLVRYKANLDPTNTTTYPDRQMADTISMTVQELEYRDNGTWEPMATQPAWATQASGDITNDTSTVPGFGGSAIIARVNINTATREQLLTLPGIGPARASAILEARRERTQVFARYSVLAEETGIPESVLNDLRDRGLIYL